MCIIVYHKTTRNKLKTKKIKSKKKKEQLKKKTLLRRGKKGLITCRKDKKRKNHPLLPIILFKK